MAWYLADAFSTWRADHLHTPDWQGHLIFEVWSSHSSLTIKVSSAFLTSPQTPIKFNRSWEHARHAVSGSLSVSLILPVRHVHNFQTWLINCTIQWRQKAVTGLFSCFFYYKKVTTNVAQIYWEHHVLQTLPCCVSGYHVSCAALRMRYLAN